MAAPGLFRHWHQSHVHLPRSLRPSQPHPWYAHLPIDSAGTRTYQTQANVKLLINGEFVESKATSWMDVINPATQQVVSRCPQSTPEEFNAAVAAAKAAFPAWRNTPVPTRQRVMFKLAELVRAHKDELASAITTEQGKTIADAHGDVFRGLGTDVQARHTHAHPANVYIHTEVIEYTCNMGPDLMGELLENVSTGIDTYSIKQPLGVCAGIVPFNFPFMVPAWMFPVAITAGNTFVLKPSEKVPGAAMMLAELALQAGVPRWVGMCMWGCHVYCDEVDSSTTHSCMHYFYHSVVIHHPPT